MADADWGRPAGVRAQRSTGYSPSGTAQNPYVHPAHGGPAMQRRAALSGQGPRPGQDPHAAAAAYGAPPAYGAPDPYAGAGARAAHPPARAGHGAAAPDPHAQAHAHGYGYGYAPEHLVAAPPAVASGLGRILHAGGAALSLALIAGLGIWGYQLAMRDVTGVPVVRALAGPMRIQPTDPGGEAAAHQGLAVNTIAAEGQAEGPADQVVLAPPPATLAAEDLPARSGAEVSAVPLAEAGDLPPPAAVEPAPAPAPLATAAIADDESSEDAAVAQALAMAAALAAGAQPLTGDEADLALDPAAEAVLAAAQVPASVPGVARSPRPAPRPADLVARAAASPVEIALASAAAAAPAVREVAAAEVPAGTRLVQLGAFDSEEVARAEWAALAGRFGEILEGKDRVIEMAQSGGKTFYRLRAMGFADLSDARRFCSALMAGQAACIPVVTR